MLKIVIHVLVVALALLLAAHIVPGVMVDGLYIAIIASLVIGLLNLTVKPILFVLTLPLTILTLGLFYFVLNAALILFVASFVDGFDIDGFIPALIVSLLVSLASSIAGSISD